MFKLPPKFSAIVSKFSSLFSNLVFERAGQLMLVVKVRIADKMLIYSIPDLYFAALTE